MPKKGEKMPEEWKEKIRKAHLGRSHPWQVGIPLSDEHKENIRKSRLGSSSWNKGLNLSDEHKRKIGESNTGKIISRESIDKALETRKLNNYPVLENNPNWKGGISYGNYCPKFNKKFKENVRNFFGNVCVICGKTKEHNSNYELAIHHVNYNPYSMCDDSPKMFVPLCIGCHNKTRTNVEYWKVYFTSLINEKYEGKCYDVELL